MRKIKLFIGICFVICVGIESCFAQSSNLKFDIYGPKNGLSDSNVTTVLEDQYGFIWIGTENGLNLYDGYSFTTFRNNADDPGSINHNWVRCLLEDNDKNIWVGTSIGLDKFNRDTNTFDHFPIDPNNSNSFPNAIAKTLLQDSKGNLWIGTSVGISIYRKETNDFLNIQGNAISQNSQANALKGTKVSGIEEDESGRIWIGTDGGLSMTTNLGKSFTHYSSSNDNNSENTISSSHVNSMYLDSQNRLWIGFFDQGIDLMDLNSGSIVNYSYDDKDSESLSNNFVQAIVESKKGEIWIATDVGLNLFHSDGTFSHVRKDQNDEFSLSSDITMSLMIDDKDNMWVGTRLGGVCFYDNDKYRFGLFRHNYDDPNSLSSNNTSGFAEDKFGNLAIATDGTGINFYNKNTNDFTFIKHDPNDNNSITNNKVLALEYDDKGGLWIGMWNGGVNYYNPVTGKIKRYKNDPNDKNSLPTNHIFDLFQDRKGNVWIGTWGSGLVLYRSETDDFTSFFNEYDEVNSQRLKGINHIVEDEVGNLWIADEQAGLVVFNYETGDVKHYVAKGGEGDISNICTYTILIDSKKRVWVGTNTGGLNLLNKETDKFTAFTKKDGLPSDDILGLLEDDAGYIWASTKLGLSKIDPENMTFKNYDERDGLQSNQFMHRNRLKLSTGELVFGGNNGFNKFNPKNLKDNEIEPPVFITNFKLFNKTVPIDEAGVLKKSITFTDELVLNYDQNFFSFEYLGLNFKQTEKNQYKYIMDGLQDEWVDAGSERKVAYTNMNPGKYTFKVKAANNDGLWSSQPVELKIEITPPYWSTWWFRSLAIISLISLIFWLYKRRLKQLMLDKQLLEQKVKEATERVISQNSELKVQSELLQAAIEETNFVVEDAIASGNFKARIDLEQKTGAWKALGGSVNQLFETVARPFNAINTIVNHMADGDLRERYREEAKGDILILAENLNQAMDNLSGLLADISNQTEEIGDSANDMLESSQEMNSSTGEIASAISEMSAGAQDQVMKIDESSGLIEAILGASNEMGDQAESINSAAKMGVEKSDDGIALISKVDHSMKDILAFSIQTDQSIATLTEKAQDISSVLRIIKEIAAQTNLLALNAAIEAAQAGDAGRGFSVVAEEIRKLAEDSKKSAGEIESLISEVQKGTKSTAELVGVMSDNIKQCEAATTESMTTFESITKYYDQTLEKSEQIVTATKQQTGDIGNVLAIISGIVVIAEETAAGTEQTASSSSELSVGMMNYTQKSKQVSDITKELKGRVDKFKL